MANVMEILGRIKTAIYGRDVRQSIYDAILQCYNDATGNPESIAAHTGDTNNPHNVTAEQVGLANAAEDISQAKKDISGLKNPEFEDFTAEGSTPPDARTAIAAITSKMSFFTYLSKVKAALMGLVTLGEMRSLLINNGLTTEAGKYFLDAAYGKTLSDLVASNASAIAQLNSDIQYGEATIENGKGTITFPHAFSNIPSICAVGKGSSDTVGTFCKISSVSKSSVGITVYEVKSGSFSLPSYRVSVTWIAIGKN